MKTIHGLGIAALVGCSSVASPTVDASAPDAPGPDSGEDGPAPPARCAWDAPFTGTAAVAGLVVPGEMLYGARLSADELTLFLSGYDGTSFDLFEAHRASATGPFSTPRRMTELNSSAGDFDADLSRDGLRLWFGSNRSGASQIYVAGRPSPGDGFGVPTLADGVNDGFDAGQPFETVDGAELWFASSRAPQLGGRDLWRATWDGVRYTNPQHVDGLSSGGEDWWPMLSDDGLTLYFASNGGQGFDIYRAHRVARNAPFAAPVRVDALNTAGDDFASWLSPDDCRLYLTQGPALLVATRAP